MMFSRSDKSQVWMQGCRFDALSQEQAVASVMQALQARRGGWMVTANLDHLRRMKWAQDGYDALCAQAELIVADGMPLIWASRVQGTPLPQRVAGSDLIWSLSGAAAKSGRSTFLLGGAGDTARRAADVLCERFPALRMAGHYAPPAGFEHNERQRRVIDQHLVESRADLVYVALGDDLLLIISGAQILRQPLCDVAINLARRSSPVTLAVHDGGAPCDIALASAGALQPIRAIGYVDVKEQGLIELARTGSVDVARCGGETTVPIRTFSGYLHALLVLIGSILCVAGSDVAGKFLPALVVLGFLVPVPSRVRDLLALPLQNIASNATQRTLELLGADVQRS